MTEVPEGWNGETAQRSGRVIETREDQWARVDTYISLQGGSSQLCNAKLTDATSLSKERVWRIAVDVEASSNRLLLAPRM